MKLIPAVVAGQTIIFVERKPGAQPPTWLDLLTSHERDSNPAQSIAGARAAA